MRVLSRLPAACAALLLTACGGDGSSSGGGGGGTASNSPPAFAGSAAATVDENTILPAYVVAASDADGDAITFSFAGGDDRGAFVLNPNTGSVSFTSPPDFEAPADSDGDNVYEFVIAASDGVAQATRAITITVRDVVDSFIARRRGVGFTEPVFLTGAGDNSGDVLVVERGGLVRVLDPDTGAIAASAFLDVAACIETAGERGLLGFALAPDFAASKDFYVYVIATGSLNSEILKFTAGAANPPCGDRVLSFPQVASGEHKGGWIGFGNDGHLYIASGDGGGGNLTTTNPAQDTSSLLGKILRIDVSTDDFPADPDRDYRIPFGNPFALGGGAPEVYAVGLRNPWRASFDEATGVLYIGDVGQDDREEVDMIPPSAGGRNFGWVRFEGTLVENASEVAPGALLPVLQYNHGGGPFEGFSITGGVVNRGPVEALENDYIFGDFITGKIWSAPVENFSQGAVLAAGQFTVQTNAFTPDFGAIDNISSFGTDDDGNVYVVDYDGEIFRMETP